MKEIKRILLKNGYKRQPNITLCYPAFLFKNEKQETIIVEMDDQNGYVNTLRYVLDDDKKFPVNLVLEGSEFFKKENDVDKFIDNCQEIRRSRNK